MAYGVWDGQNQFNKYGFGYTKNHSFTGENGESYKPNDMLDRMIGDSGFYTKLNKYEEDRYLRPSRMRAQALTNENTAMQAQRDYFGNSEDLAYAGYRNYGDGWANARAGGVGPGGGMAVIPGGDVAETNRSWFSDSVARKAQMQERQQRMMQQQQQPQQQAPTAFEEYNQGLGVNRFTKSVEDWRKLLPQINSYQWSGA